MQLHENVQTIRSGPDPAQAAAAVIFLHGRGSSGEDGRAVADALSSDKVAFVSPTAHRGSWYPHRFLVPLEMNEPWLGSALAVVDELIQELRDAGLPRERIALMGFSQGACLALEYASRAGGRFAFVGALSGALVGPLDAPHDGPSLDGTPVLIGCAARDAHIPIEHVERSAELLADRGAAVEKLIFPGAAHNIFGEELDWIGDRLAELKQSQK